MRNARGMTLVETIMTVTLIAVMGLTLAKHGAMAYWQRTFSLSFLIALRRRPSPQIGRCSRI